MNWELLGMIIVWITFIGSIGFIGVIEYIWRVDPSANLLYYKPTYKGVLPFILSGLILGVYYFG